LNGWHRELDVHTNTFRRQALDIAKYDQVLVENSDKIMELHGHVQRITEAQRQMEGNLEQISRQQEALHQLLEALEQQADQTYKEHQSKMTPDDIEREKSYQMAENINADLDQMANVLKEIISKLNTAQDKPSDQDAVYQIVKILDNDLHALQRMEIKCTQLQVKLDKVDKLLQSF